MNIFQTDKKRIDWLANITVAQKNCLQKLSNGKPSGFWDKPEKAFRALIDEVIDLDKKVID